MLIDPRFIRGIVNKISDVMEIKLNDIKEKLDEVRTSVHLEGKYREQFPDESRTWKIMINI